MLLGATWELWIQKSWKFILGQELGHSHNRRCMFGVCRRPRRSYLETGEQKEQGES